MADSISIGSLRAFNTDSCFPTAWHGPSDGTSLVIVRPVCAVDSRRSFMVAALGPCSLMNRIDQGKVVNPSPSATSLDLSKAVPLSAELGHSTKKPFFCDSPTCRTQTRLDASSGFVKETARRGGLAPSYRVTEPLASQAPSGGQERRCGHDLGAVSPLSRCRCSWGTIPVTSVGQLTASLPSTTSETLERVERMHCCRVHAPVNAAWQLLSDGRRSPCTILHLTTN